MTLPQIVQAKLLLHFHVIPKHKDLVSICYYCFANLWEEEGKRETSESELNLLSNALKSIVESLYVTSPLLDKTLFLMISLK